MQSHYMKREVLPAELFTKNALVKMCSACEIYQRNSLAMPPSIK